MPGSILVADDSLTVRMHLEGVLGRAGFAVALCDSHAELLGQLGREPCSLLIVDPALRGGGGLELVQNLRTRRGKTAAPILVLSGQADIRRRVRAMEVGASDVIDKPFHDDYLLKRVLELTSKARKSSTPDEEPGPDRILVVDDSATYSNALADELRRDGHDVVIARSASEAISLLNVQRAAAVVLDVFMPEVSGVQLCRRLRGDASMRNTSILVLTGRQDGSLRDVVLEAGADAFVTKTHELTSIRERVRELLRRPRRGLRAARRNTIPPPPSRASSPLLDEVIAASGLSKLLGQSSLKRACERAFVDPATMTPGELGRALPFIAEVLSAFMPRGEVQARMERIAALSDRESAA